MRVLTFTFTRWLMTSGFFKSWLWPWLLFSPLCTAACESCLILTVSSSRQWRNADASGLGWRSLQRGCAAASPRILLSTGHRQLTDQDPLQAAVVHALTKPPTTWKPGWTETTRCWGFSFSRDDDNDCNLHKTFLEDRRTVSGTSNVNTNESLASGMLV